MDQLLRQRRVLKGNITRAENNLAKLVDPIKQDLLIRYSKDVIRFQKETEELLDKMVQECIDEEFPDQEKELHAIFDRLDALEVNIKELTTPPVIVTSQSPSAPLQSTTQKSNGVRLPKLELPNFTGNLADWMSFADLFAASVHNNKSLSDAQKLQYLKGCVKGEAASLLQSVQITDDNYAPAWESLLSRYHNERDLVNSHLKRLLSQPPLTHESPSGLRKLVDTTKEVVRALDVLQQPIDTGPLIVYLITEKVDPESRREWALSLKDDKIHDYDEFIEYMDQRARGLMEAGNQKTKFSIPFKSTNNPNKSFAEKPKATSKSFHSSTENTKTCGICRSNHFTRTCPELLALDPRGRTNMVRSKGLCLNCLSSSHPTSECLRGPCPKCQRKGHNGILHWDKPTLAMATNPTEESSLNVVHSTESIKVLLSTAIVQVKDARGQQHLLRAFLDGGSQSSFITEDAVQKLGIKRNRVTTALNGLAGVSVGTANGGVKLNISSVVGDSFIFDLNALILTKITNPLPNFHMDPANHKYLRNVPLADPNYYQPGKIDLLIGADKVVDLMLDGRIHGPDGTPRAQNTVLGWILSGEVFSSDERRTSVQSSTAIFTYHSTVDLDLQLKKFWQLEEVNAPPYSLEEKQCETHFKSTHSRGLDGRYTVRLPFITNLTLGESRNRAIHRLQQMERRLKADPKLAQEYSTFMKEYLDLGHMAAVPSHELVATPNYYLPHHAVIKEASTTTKLRVVFDGSAKSSNGNSLNDTLLVGPRLQQDVIPILLRFRTHKIAITADIAKMYRQIWVDTEEQQYQRIVWRFSSADPIQDYNLKTVTYGTGPAPYLATKCLQQLALDENLFFPMASEITLRDFYMDDLMTGTSDLNQALDLQESVRQLLAKGGFQLRKFSSNSPELLSALPSEECETQVNPKWFPITIDEDSTVKILGLYWHPGPDTFSFVVNIPDRQELPTKRNILSDVAKLFDPLGWLSPIIITAKILLQSLWSHGLDWDEPLPDHLAHQWLEFRNSLQLLEEISIPRWLHNLGTKSGCQLHGFSDASEKAYSAVVFLRVEAEDGTVEVTMVTSKTKVAPLKLVTLPRLELCGAVLSARLISNVKNALCLDTSTTFAWTDSTVVLAWIKGHPNQWKTFIANRVSEIQDLIPPQGWKHIRSQFNPADCASRGISPTELKDHHLWWNGPPWIKGHPSTWPDSNPEIDYESARLESKLNKTSILTATTEPNSLFTRYSSLEKLKRITSLCLRFINNINPRRVVKRTAPLSPLDLQDALHRLIRIMQVIEFSEELKCCTESKDLPRKSKLLRLNPFLDKDTQLLKVGGRLSLGKLHSDRKFPIILPKDHPLTQLIVSQEHIRSCHAGPQLLLATIQAKYWILCGRNVVRRHISKCITCYRQRSKTAQQQMGNLPSCRITPNSKPFTHTGVDYAGPVTIKRAPGRCKLTSKGYITIFVCMTTKATHLELVSDLTTATFIAALHRFVARRGRCLEIYSDNGTTFVGANNELQELRRLTLSETHQREVNNFLSKEGIKWHFSPPRAPHHGGLWEAAVKSTKFHIRRVLGTQTLTFESYTTLLAQVEACLNSRPLCAMSSDPNDLAALTPGHFLIGEPLLSIPEPDLIELPDNRLSHWQRIQQSTQHFWKRWSSEYISTLQQRLKWTNSSPDLRIDDLVLIKEDNTKPLEWNLGRVIQLHPGKDNKVRVVSVKCSQGILKRPIVKLCPLPVK